jgi:hypothetical protein
MGARFGRAFFARLLLRRGRGSGGLRWRSAHHKSQSGSGSHDHRGGNVNEFHFAPQKGECTMQYKKRAINLRRARNRAN